MLMTMSHKTVQLNYGINDSDLMEYHKVVTLKAATPFDFARLRCHMCLGSPNSRSEKKNKLDKRRHYRKIFTS